MRLNTVGFVFTLALGLLTAPLAPDARPPATVPRIGLLETGSLAAREPLWGAFRQAMRELGYVEGRNVVFEARGADGKVERLAALEAELVQLKVDVIVTAATPAAPAARLATATIPIVMATGGDPVGLGIVQSLARPGGNVTGVTTLSVGLSAKRFELAREVIPGASRLAILGEAGSATTAATIQETQAVARAQGVRLHAVGVWSPAELDGAFSTIARERPAVLLVIGGSMFFAERRRLAELAVKHRLPTVVSFREYAEAGGLVDKILKGTKPGDLPVEQPTKFELVINLKTAKALGLTIPRQILLRADKVIE